MNRNRSLCYLLPGFALVVLAVANLLCGPVSIPAGDVADILFGNYDGRQSWSNIVLESRLPSTVTALLSGASLAVCGLLLQTLFSNPLAGPSILGISDGANLGVAGAMLYAGAASYAAMVGAAFAGAAAVLALLIAFSRRVQSNVMLLIIGIMVGYLASSAISILNFHAAADKVQQFVMWGMGDFGNVSLEKLPWFISFSCAGLFLSLLLIKPLNALLLGESYASNLGVNVQRTRILILLCTGILCSSVTAFCGPISFIGLAVPHLARLFLGTSNHNFLLPVTMLLGSCMALLCNVIATLPGNGALLPLNAVTSLTGAPVIIYVILNRRNIKYFN